MHTYTSDQSVEKTKLISDEDLKEKNLDKPGCCLILCICPWRPRKVATFLLGSKKKNKSNEKSKIVLEDKRLNENLFMDTLNTKRNEKKSSFRQKYYNTFHKRLFNHTNQAKAKRSVTEENEFATNDDSLPSYDTSISVASTNYSKTKYMHFVDTFTFLAMYPFRNRNESPVFLLNTDRLWVKYNVPNSDTFILAVQATDGSNLVLGALYDLPNRTYLNVYSISTIERSTASLICYEWKLEYTDIPQQFTRKYLLRCANSSPALYVAHEASTDQLFLSSDFEDGLVNWQYD